MPEILGALVVRRQDRDVRRPVTLFLQDDYGAQGKGKYIDAFFKNLNWSVIEGRFTTLSGWKPN